MKKTNEIDEIVTKIRYDAMKSDGVRNPVEVDSFVDKIYNLIKEEGFNIIEAETIVKELGYNVENDKKLILLESLKTVEKYKEG